MRDLPLTLLHLVVAVAKLCGPGGVRGLIAENLVLKQQLIVLRRARRRAPNLTRRDRLLCGFWSLIHSQGTPRHLSTDHDPLFEAHRWRAIFGFSRSTRSRRCRMRPRHTRSLS